VRGKERVVAKEVRMRVSAAEKLGEGVAATKDLAEDALRVHKPKLLSVLVPAAPTSTASTDAGSPRVPVGVVHPSLCRVREDLVRLGHQLEHVLGALVALVLVRVEPDGQLLVRLPGEERVA